MTPRLGRCALCLKQTELQLSHLLPKGLYRLIREAVHITSNSAWPSSRQIQDYLLCHDCEQRFNRHGEDWILSHCYRGRRFRLREILKAGKPLGTVDGLSLYSASALAAVDVPRIAYFAASVFWRASAHQWHTNERDVEDIDLGKRYREEFRQYLLGDAGFPLEATLIVDVCSFQSPALASAMFPTGRNDSGYHYFTFSIPGILFYLFTGQRIPPGIRDCCILRSPERCLFSSLRDDAIVERHLGLMKTARPSRKLQKRG